MKAINKFFYALLAFVAVGMVSCTEEATHEPGAPELEGCYGVYFPDASVYENQGPLGELSVDPSEATVYTYAAFRENTDGEVTVPVQVFTNTADADGNPMFTVEPIVFEDGEEVATFKVTLSSKAEVGVPYTLTMGIVNDPQYVKQYDTQNTTQISITINRVKWIEVGYLTDEQGGKWCEYSEDMVAAWYGFTQPLVYPVKVSVRADSVADEAKFLAALEGNGTEEDLVGIYRVSNAYYPFEGISGFTPYDASFYIYVDAVDKVHIPLSPVGLKVNDGSIGDVMIYSMVHYYLDNGAKPSDDMYGSVRGGKITFPVQMLLGCPGGSYAGKNTYYVNSNGLWWLNIAPALGSYELAMPNAESDGDFSFSELNLPGNAVFYSESQNFYALPAVEKGRCEVNTKDADREFYSNYGVLYRLVEPYAEGANIYFAAKADGTVTLPEAYLSQFTGIVQNGYEVMMEINAAESSFDAESGELKLVADFAVYAGDERLSYGSYREVITTGEPEFNVAPAVDLASDFSYKKFYAVPMESTFMQTTIEDATLMVGTATTQNSALFASVYGSVYKLPSLYTEGYDIYFVADEKGNVSVAPGYEVQATGQYVLGKKAFLNIVSGTCTEQNCTLNIKVCDAEGNLLLPALCAETMVNLIWNEVATGTYTNGLITSNGQPIPISGRKLLHAEGTNQYRITNYWGYEGYDLNFTWDKTTNKCEITGTCDTGYFSSSKGGNFWAADCKTAYALAGKNYSWATLEENGYKQPYYDAANNTFVFVVMYVVYETGSIFNPVYDTFVLDGEVTTVEWQNYAVGTFTHTTDFYAPTNYLPYAEKNLTLQRYGETNKFKIVGVAGGSYDIELTYDAASGLVTVPSQKTGLQYKESDGSMTDIYLGDYWAILKDWGAESQGYTQDMVYEAYPNSYDAASQTFSFYLGYYDHYGYTYTSVDEGNPTVHTFQITGAASSASVSEATKSFDKAISRVKKQEVVSKFANASVKATASLKLSNKVEVKKVNSIYTATPVRKAKTPMVSAF